MPLRAPHARRRARGISWSTLVHSRMRGQSCGAPVGGPPGGGRLTMRYRLHMCIRNVPTLPLLSGLRAGGREDASGGGGRRPPTRLCKKTPRRLHAHLRRGVPGHESPSRIQPAEFASHTTHAPARLRHGFGLRNCTHAVRRSSLDLKTPPMWTINHQSLLETRN